MRGGEDRAWCILRTSARNTLALAASLAEDGFEVWSPVETVTVRVPRMNARRQVRRPILPSYVFARAPHLVDLLQLAEMRVKPAHPDFSVLHAFGKIPVVADADFASLRRLEAKRTPRKVAEYTLPRNERARVNGGICQGMIGTVIRSTPARTMLVFGAGRRCEIPTSLLDPESLQGDKELPRLRAA